jgi:4-amino-4-deoxy-L-arabinose transferase-like glycosyltransferase
MKNLKLAISSAKQFSGKALESARNNAVPLAIAVIFLVALALRAWGIRFGLPNLYHPDEWAVFDRALAMMRTGDFNPHDFIYPTVYMYMQLAWLVVSFFYGVSKGLYTSVSDVNVVDLYLWGRFLTALLGALTVYVTYLTGRELFGRKVGLLSALLLTFSFLHLRDSHYITVDVPAVFFLSISLFFAVRILRSGEIFDYSMSGLFAGLAIATKWNAFPIVIAFVAAYFIQSFENRKLGGRVFYAFLFLAIGLFIGAPYAFLNLPIFLSSVGGVLTHYRGGHVGFEASKPYIFYIKNLSSSEGMGVAVFVAVAVGLLLSLIRHKKEDFFLIVFPLLYYAFISRSKVTFPRNTLPLYAVLPLYGGIFLAQLSDFSKKLFEGRSRRLGLVMFGFALTLVIALPVVRVIQFDVASAGKDTRTLSGRWIEENLPHGSKIAAEFYGPPISGNFEVVKIPFLEHSPEWFREQEFDYVVFDSADHGRFFVEPEVYPEQVKHYQRLFKLGKILKRYDSDKSVELFLSPEILIAEMKK